MKLYRSWKKGNHVKKLQNGLRFHQSPYIHGGKTKINNIRSFSKLVGPLKKLTKLY